MAGDELPTLVLGREQELKIGDWTLAYREGLTHSAVHQNGDGETFHHRSCDTSTVANRD